MQIESLKVFCDLTETQSFTKAAKLNGVTQSAVSQTLSALERQFKSLLVERSKKNFRLTADGEVVYEYARKVLQTYASLNDKILEIKDIISGNIRVATIYSIGLHMLPPYIKPFLKEFPTVNVHVEYRRHNQVYEDVQGNVVDLGLIAYPVRDPRLEIVQIRKDPLVLICHPQNPLAKTKLLKYKALDGAKFISFDPDIPTRRALDKAFKQHGVVVDHVMEFDNVETVKRAVEIDSGVAIVPLDTIRQDVINKTLVAVKLEDPEAYRSLAIIHKKNKVLSPATKQFMALLKKPIETPV